jgi:tRNA (guanine37-N1)-methyltransferase
VKIDVLTIFPQVFGPYLEVSLLGKAIASGKLQVEVRDLRDHGLGKHRSVDDEPYGGGAGMVMRPEPIAAALDSIPGDPVVVLLSPRGHLLTHERVVTLSQHDHIALICGRYEGVDERIIDDLVDIELSIGDYVLAGGELPALVLIEAVSRHLPGVLGNPASLDSESHAGGLLEYPQYTRPAEFRGRRVPEVLLSGDHAAVARWRAEKAEELTRERRPDLSP